MMASEVIQVKQIQIILVYFSGGEITQRTQSAQHSENTWEDADRKQESVTALFLKHCVKKT